ncbi:aspartyl/asparaginyl beta-hydroxylase domain-containing protein [Sphingomonas sp. KR3-1]|uniref:aspartyl/asparaginyl beta-hydroxylase domain-containing protein n=1 Tax=Sphingomonas sp. KR3-1 TaxID=3156611 RepID=UPI0032B42289
MWRDSGEVDAAQAREMIPDLTVMSGAVMPDMPLRADRHRPFLIKYGKHLRGALDRFIARFSLVSTDPVLDVRDFAWTEALRANWQAIRAEAIAAAFEPHLAPSLALISPDHRAIAPANKWRSFFLYGYGYLVQENLDRCPVTTRLVEAIPGLNSAFFSILAPGTHIPAHRGVTKGLITCHLGLIVPRDGDARMRIDDRVLRWAEGETLVFDDTYDHEVWNDTSGTRVVLLIQFRRPLRQPGRWFVDRFLAWIRGSAFVQDARTNLIRWNGVVNTTN